jgi:potassium/chloride transporter 9
MRHPTTETSTLLPKPNQILTKSSNRKTSKRQSLKKKPVVENAKLGTFEGVFLPTSLNVLSILMFLRFGFIIGQMGIAGTFFLLVLSYSIDILTTMSISAISTNGTVKGGGAYYMISRSLGPEFGGAIGIIFFIGQILNSSLNVVGFIEPLLVNFGNLDGELFRWLPVSYLWQILYSTILLAICTCVALVGSALVSKTAFWLFIVLTLSTLSIPVSSLFVKPFHPLPPPLQDITYTGLSWTTFVANLWPQFTSGAAGSVQPAGQPETFRNLFGIFFPATAGIFAGASMSGELKNPSKSIPEGTLKGLFVTFILYSLVIISLGSSIPRDLLHADIKVIQTVNILGIIIIMGEFSTSLFSVIMGIVGAASMLNAIADDRIIPGLSIFTTNKKTPKQKHRAKIYSIIATWFIAQVFLFADINQIATFITMAFLMTFIVTNIACFLLKVGSAPNFRPSFKYFSSRTALTGVVVCVIAMFIVDGLSATLVIFFLMFLIMMIHYLTPPSKFGDISQLLIYHQVRKYLLRLKLHISVQYWRPQILLLCDDPRSGWNLIGFCNHLKKGGLYILGHVVIMNDENKFGGSSEFTVEAYKEIQKQKQAWIKLRDLSKIKAFVQIALGPTLPWGVRNVYLGSGLGGMRPNITVIGFYDFVKHGVDLPVLSDFDDKIKISELPTDDCRKERKVAINQWVQIVEDLMILQATVAVAANFGKLELPKTDPTHHNFWSKPKVTNKDGKKKYIDLYPIQMSSVNQLDDGKSVLSTNFDTCTLIMQLGAILFTVPEWKFSGHTLRIIAFVETTQEVEDETTRLSSLLTSLRIEAEIKVVCLDDGSLTSFNFLVKGYSKNSQNKGEYDKLDQTLKDDQWWQNLCNARLILKDIESQRQRKQQLKLSHLQKSINSSRTSLYNDRRYSPLNLSSTSPSMPISTSLMNRRYTLSNLHEQGVSLSFNMNTQSAGQFNDYEAAMDSSDSSESDKEDSYESDVSEVSEISNRESITYGSGSTRSPSPFSRPSTEFLKPTNKTISKLKEPPFGAMKSADQLSIKSSRSNLRPNFLSVKIPQSQIDDDDDNEDEEAEYKSSIRFVADHEDEDNNAENDGDDDEEEDESKSKPHEPTGFEDKDYFTMRPPISKKQSSSLLGPKRSTDALKSPSVITNDDEIIHHMKTPQFRATEEEDDGLSKMDDFSLRSALTFSATHKNEAPKKPKPAPNDDKTITQKQLQEEMKNLTFNDLPAKGQHLILNDLMRKHSPPEVTAVIFSTLPAPPIGTHLDDADSFEYTNNLAIWLDELAPILLLNSQTVTVTTAL